MNQRTNQRNDFDEEKANELEQNMEDQKHEILMRTDWYYVLSNINIDETSTIKELKEKVALLRDLYYWDITEQDILKEI